MSHGVHITAGTAAGFFLLQVWVCMYCMYVLSIVKCTRCLVTSTASSLFAFPVAMLGSTNTSDLVNDNIITSQDKLYYVLHTLWYHDDGALISSSDYDTGVCCFTVICEVVAVSTNCITFYCELLSTVGIKSLWASVNMKFTVAVKVTVSFCELQISVKCQIPVLVLIDVKNFHSIQIYHLTGVFPCEFISGAPSTN